MTMGMEAEQRDPWLDEDDLRCNSNAMRRVYRDHICDETVVQAIVLSSKCAQTNIYKRGVLRVTERRCNMIHTTIFIVR